MDMWAVLLVTGVWLLAALKRGYTYLPAHELKRRASRGNAVLHKLAPTAQYQPELRLLFNGLIYITFLALVTYVASRFSLLNEILIISLACIGFIYFSNKNYSISVRLCAWLASYIVLILQKLHPIYKKMSTLRRSRPITTDIYERDDLKKFIGRQKLAVNNRISLVDLEAVAHVLEFEHRKIATVMVPYKDIRFVNAKEPIGPILLSELHKSGFHNFPVLGNSKNEILGILSLKTVAEYEEGGIVTEAMDSDVVYVRDNQPLEQVMQAFSKTGKHLFMVVDMREKVVGLITICDVLEEVIGHTIHGEFEDYDSLEAVSHQ